MESTRWQWHVLNPAAADDVDTLSQTAEALVEHMMHTGPEHMDLTQLAGQPVHPVHLALVLRLTSRWREQVPGWGLALAAAQGAAGDDAADVLLGLI